MKTLFLALMFILEWVLLYVIIAWSIAILFSFSIKQVLEFPPYIGFGGFVCLCIASASIIEINEEYM